MATPFIAEIRMFSFNFPPKGNAFCQGQLLPINQNQALFSLLGTTYGGNGTVNFALPDLRGRAPVHVGTGAGLPAVVLGELSGEENHTLLAGEMPQHNHLVAAASDTPDSPTPAANRWTASGNSIYTSAAANATMHAAALGNAGGSQPHSNMQPSLVLNFSIALQGIFPSRN